MALVFPTERLSHWGELHQRKSLSNVLTWNALVGERQEQRNWDHEVDDSMRLDWGPTQVAAASSENQRQPRSCTDERNHVVSACCTDIEASEGSNVSKQPHADTTEEKTIDIESSEYINSNRSLSSDFPMLVLDDSEREVVASILDEIDKSADFVCEPVFQARKLVVWSKDIWEVQAKVFWVQTPQIPHGFDGAKVEKLGQHSEKTWVWLIEKGRGSSLAAARRHALDNLKASCFAKKDDGECDPHDRNDRFKGMFFSYFSKFIDSKANLKRQVHIESSDLSDSARQHLERLRSILADVNIVGVVQLVTANVPGRPGWSSAEVRLLGFRIGKAKDSKLQQAIEESLRNAVNCVRLAVERASGNTITRSPQEALRACSSETTHGISIVEIENMSKFEAEHFKKLKAMISARIQGSMEPLVLLAIAHDPSGAGWTMQVKLSEKVLGEAQHPKRSVAGETAIRTALAAVLHETKESAVANDNEWEWCFAPSPKEVQLLQRLQDMNAASDTTIHLNLLGFCDRDAAWTMGLFYDAKMVAKARHVHRSAAGIAVLLATISLCVERNGPACGNTMHQSTTECPHSSEASVLKDMPQESLKQQEAGPSVYTKSAHNSHQTFIDEACTIVRHNTIAKVPIQNSAVIPNCESDTLIQRIQAHYRTSMQSHTTPQVELLYRRMDTPLYSCPACWEVHVIVDGERLGRAAHSTSSSIAAELATDDCIGLLTHRSTSRQSAAPVINPLESDVQSVAHADQKPHLLPVPSQPLLKTPTHVALSNKAGYTTGWNSTAPRYIGFCRRQQFGLP
eukprot:m.987125 g.987125  ORF g.987125 m.987125 type:complete len:798 (+) comp23990_c0_seq42:821-3214(+)